MSGNDEMFTGAYPGFKTGVCGILYATRFSVRSKGGK